VLLRSWIACCVGGEYFFHFFLSCSIFFLLPTFGVNKNEVDFLTATKIALVIFWEIVNISLCDLVTSRPLVSTQLLVAKVCAFLFYYCI